MYRRTGVAGLKEVLDFLFFILFICLFGFLFLQKKQKKNKKEFPDDGRRAIAEDLHTCRRSLYAHMRRTMCPRSVSHVAAATAAARRQHRSGSISKTCFTFILLLLIFTPRVDSSWW